MSGPQEIADDLDRTERFVGRAGVLRRLRREIEDLARQAPRIGLAVVIGDEGVGKGRLLRELAEQAETLGIQALSARPALSAYALYRPFTDVLGAPDAARGQPEPGSARGLPARLDPATATKLKERALGRLRALAAARPLALFLHELERADPFTYELLDYLPRHRDRAPALVVASVAPGVAGFPYQRIRTEPFCRELHMAPWSERDVEQYLRTQPRFAKVAGALAELLARKTGGRPALVLQVLRLMVEEGIAPEEGSEPAEAMERLHGFPMPRNMNDIVARRLARRSAEEQAVVLALAVISRPATPEEITATSLQEHRAVVSALAKAVEAGLAVERRTGRRTTYEIRSRAMRQAILATSPPDEAGRQHERLAAMLDASRGVADPLELAHHHARAGHPLEASRYALMVKARLDSERAYEQGIELFEDCLALSPSGADRASLNAAVADFCFALSAFDRSLRYVRAAREEWSRIGRRREEAASLQREAAIHQARSEFVMAARAAHAALALAEADGDEEGQGRALSEIGLIESSRGRYDDAGAVLARALQIQRKARDAEGLLHTLNTIGSLRYYQGDYQASRRAYEEALALARRQGVRASEKRAQANLAGIEMVLGHMDAAHLIYRRVLAMERDTGDLYGEAITRYNIGLVMQHSLRYGRALKAYAAAAALMERVGNRRGLHSTLGNMAAALLSVGDASGCLAHLEPASRLAVEIGDRRAEAATLFLFGLYHSEKGGERIALEYLEASLAKAIAIHERRYEMLARHALAMTSIKFGRVREAAAHSLAFLAVARKGGEPEFLARAHLSDGMRMLMEGESLRARAVLMTALGMARKAGDRALELEARIRLVEALDRGGETQLALREREKAVAQIREVAARMGSPRLRRAWLESSPRKELLAT